MILLSLAVSMMLCLKSPFYLTMGLLVLSMSVGVLAGKFVSKWLFAAIFLVFLGGMLIVFFYVVSLTQDKKMSVSFSLTEMSIFVMICVCFIYPESGVSKDYLSGDLFLKNSNLSLVVLTFLLFMCLVGATKMSENFKGALCLKL